MKAQVIGMFRQRPEFPDTIPPSGDLLAGGIVSILVVLTGLLLDTGI